MPKGRRHYRITLTDVMKAHGEALKYGGAEGIINLSLIKSAIGRPYTGYYRQIYKKAAALTHSLCRNHGFTDGNKRTALICLRLMLKRSGHKLINTPEIELENLIIDIAIGEIDFDALTNWFKTRIKKKPAK